MLIFDVLDDRVPATGLLAQNSTAGLGAVPSIVVDLISIARCVHNVQSQAHTVLLDDCRICQFSCLSGALRTYCVILSESL